MKTTRCLLAILVLSLTVSVTRGAPALRLVDKGVELNTSGMGQFILETPELRFSGGRGEKPAATLANDTLTVQYPSGLTLDCTVDAAAGRVACHFTGAPAGAEALRFLLYIPLKFNQGGKFAFDGQWRDIPPAKAAQFLHQGSATTFSVADPLGESITVATPGGWQGLQDNRVFDWPVYVYVYHYNFMGKTEGWFGFTVKFGAGQTGKFLVDRFGQSATKDFPGKITGDAELKAAAAAEQLPPRAGPALDEYGGLAGSGARYGLPPTGFFRVAKAADREVLVTPAGNVFFQLAVCGLNNCDDYTRTRGREHIFEWLPAADDEQYRTAWRPRDPGVFSFQIANWIRLHGRPYSYEDWTAHAAARLHAWGFNSLGAFSVYSNALRRAHFPTVDILPDAPAIPHIPLGPTRAPDPFAPGFAAALDQLYAKEIAPRAGDPLLIGYFLGNEQAFEKIPTVVPALRADSPAKRELVTMLRDKYTDIAKFNTAWQPAKPFATFDELPDAQLFPTTPAATADMREYLVRFMDAYYAHIARAFRKHDPNHLLLGSRWTPTTAKVEEVTRAAGRHLDLVSINYYTHRVDLDFLRRIHEQTGKPLILSEWYFASGERGLGGGREVRDQRERGLAYRNYVEQTAALPFVVGAQWFIYTDQALSGRFFEGFNGEGANTGLVDVTDRPYAELITALRQTHARIYDVLFGQQPPFAYDDPRFNGLKK
ncbi:MAG: hypothetical protein LBK60_06605 [Verrucomicrobiales bacterium]|nr:hypothetical protein [Verrucomicrobiales bacterium]